MSAEFRCNVAEQYAAWHAQRKAATVAVEEIVAAIQEDWDETLAQLTPFQQGLLLNRLVELIYGYRAAPGEPTWRTKHVTALQKVIGAILTALER